MTPRKGYILQAYVLVEIHSGTFQASPAPALRSSWVRSPRGFPTFPQGASPSALLIQSKTYLAQNNKGCHYPWFLNDPTSQHLQFSANKQPAFVSLYAVHSLYNPTWIPWFLSDNENDQTSGPEASNCVASPSFACYLGVSVVSVACIANDKDEMQRMKYKGMKISYVCQSYIMYTSYIIYRSYIV